VSPSQDLARQVGRHLLGPAFLAAAALLPAGCSSPPREPAPPYQQDAAAEAKSAREAYGEGRIDSAIASLRESVRLRLSGGDLPGAARSQLNLALAERAAGDPAAASASAARLREMTPGAVQQVREQAGAGDGSREAELEAASSWLDALLALDQGDVALAQARAPARDGELAPASQMRGRIDTLHAEIALRAGRFAEAGDLARAGRAASAGAGDPSEEAHAWSLAGASHAGMGDWAGARADYLAAVGIEERIGGGARMAGDLRQLAAAAERLGDPGDARLYTQRADAIQSAGADRR
jgi:tetratricopeptide (TPR) repeat protein